MGSTAFTGTAVNLGVRCLGARWSWCSSDLWKHRTPPSSWCGRGRCCVDLTSMRRNCAGEERVGAGAEGPPAQAWLPASCDLLSAAGHSRAGKDSQSPGASRSLSSRRPGWQSVTPRQPCRSPAAHSQSFMCFPRSCLRWERPRPEVSQRPPHRAFSPSWGALQPLTL